MDQAESSSMTMVVPARSIIAPRPVLVLVEGAQAGESQERTLALTDPETVLGRTPECALGLQDPGVSRQHARVVATSRGFHLVDLGSRNGSFINGRRVTTGELHEGDRVHLGTSTVLRFSLQGGEESSSAARRAALAGSLVAIWECSLLDGSVQWNGKLDALLGVPEGTLSGRRAPLVEFVASEDRSLARTALEEATESGAPVNVELRLIAAGEARWVALRADVLRGADGQPQRLIGTVADIGARKRLEVELGKQVALFESLYDGVVMAELDARILDWNRSAERMFGFDREDAIGANLFELLGATEARRLREELTCALLRQGRWTEEVELSTRTGEPRWCEIVAVVPPGQDGDQRTCIVTHRDVSDRKRLQAQLATSERLASLGTLSAGIAHEVNNPLSFVLANLRFLEGTLASMQGPDPLLEECAEILSETQEGARRIEEIVQGLRVFSRDERREGPGPCDLRRAVESGLKLAAGFLRGKARVEASLQEVPRVCGTETQWIQLLLNLLMNAAQAMDKSPAEGSEIRVSLIAGSAGCAVLEVSDNGTGIPLEVRSRIFEPFFTTGGVGSRRGLGLAVCHGIATAHGGRIELTGEPGAGSTFRVYAPIASAVASDSGLDTLPPGGGRR